MWEGIFLSVPLVKEIIEHLESLMFHLSFFKKIELFLFSDLLNQSLLEKHVEITACYLYLKQHLEAPAGGWCLLCLVAAHSQPSSHPGPCTNEPKMAAMAELPAGGAPGSSEMAVLA